MYEIFLFFLKAAVVIFNILFYLTLINDDADSNWVFPKIPWFDDRIYWLKAEHEPIYFLVMCLLFPIVVLWSFFPLFLAMWVWSL
jgi:hypothetical protein